MWNVLKIHRLLTKSFTQIFKERYHHNRKKSRVLNLKKFLPEEAAKEKPAKDMSLSESFDFLTELSELQKLYLPLKVYMDVYFWLSLEEYFFVVFFSGVFFSQAKEKIHREKNPQKLSQWKFKLSQERNTRPEERWKNYAKRWQSQSYT